MALAASSSPTSRISIYRITLGFLISTAFALPIGVLIGCYRGWEAAIEPLVDFIRYMPVVAFVPLTILWTGTGDAQKFLIIFIGTFFQQVLLVMDNVKSVPRDFVNLGRTLEMPESRILARIVVPSAMPAIWDSMRISLGWAWTWLVVAELVAATSGLGYRITTAQRFFQTDHDLRLPPAARHARPGDRPGDEGHRPAAVPLSRGALMPKLKLVIRDLGKTFDGGRGDVRGAGRRRSRRRRQRVRLARRHVGLRQDRRFSRSPPASRRTIERRDRHRRRAGSTAPASTAASCSRATRCCPG